MREVKVERVDFEHPCLCETDDPSVFTLHCDTLDEPLRILHIAILSLDPTDAGGKYHRVRVKSKNGYLYDTDSDWHLLQNTVERIDTEFVLPCVPEDSFTVAIEIGNQIVGEATILVSLRQEPTPHSDQECSE